MHALDASTDRMKAQALAETVDTTTGFVPQVVGPLVKAGWVRSDPGPTGGYVLEVSLERLTVLDVIEAVDGPTDDGRCVVADADCDGGRPCVMHEAWTRARHELTRTLDSMSMASLDPGTLR